MFDPLWPPKQLVDYLFYEIWFLGTVQGAADEFMVKFPKLEIDIPYIATKNFRKFHKLANFHETQY